MMNKILAFLKKDFLIESSYKLAFAFNIAGVVSSLAIYYFIDTLFGHRMAGHLEEFGAGYFSYVLVAMAFFSFIGSGVGSFAYRLRAEQTQGTLESLLLTPTKIPIILFSFAAWNTAVATIDMALYFLFGVLLFGAGILSHINVFSTIVVLLLSVVSFSSLGILSASFVLIFKQGNPVSWLISQAEGLLGGVYFPVTILPAWLQFLAKFLPITYSIRALELAVHRGFSVTQLYREISALALFALLLMPLSVKAFSLSVKKARQDGSLGYY